MRLLTPLSWAWLASRHAAAFSAVAKERLPGLRSRYESTLADHDAFIQRYGKDPEWLAAE